MNYTVVISREAGRELARLAKTIAKRIFAKLDSLQQNPRPSGSTKLAGYSDLWRVRVGDYRIVYRINDDERIVTVLRVRHRGEAYDRLP